MEYLNPLEINPLLRHAPAPPAMPPPPHAPMPMPNPFANIKPFPGVNPAMGPAPAAAPPVNPAAAPIPGIKPINKPYGKKGAPCPCPVQPVCGPTNVLHCPPKAAGPVYDPQSVNVEDVFKPVIVQHIHPSHTQINEHYVYEHQHYYPHTVSHCCDEQHHHIQCGCPCYPKPTC
ncbi:CotD family spore coat protein [Terrilactibacillus sp. S3-3]|nr:CotD family spore coat protein [Terrilactibacillus sp. S3-3]